MGFTIKDEPKEIDCLPAFVSVVLTGVYSQHPRVMFRTPKGTPTHWLDVTHKSGKMTATLPEFLAKLGPGVYYLDFYDNCTLCVTIPVKFVDSCVVKEVEVGVIEEPKLPWWKEKDVDV